MKTLIQSLVETANHTVYGHLIQTDIAQYVNKIYENATIISIVQHKSLYAFIAYYDNDPDKEMAYLTMLIVNQKHQGLGYGKNLIHTAINNLKSQGFKRFKLEVKNDNLPAMNLYKKIGFVVSEVNNTSSYMIYDL